MGCLFSKSERQVYAIKYKLDVRMDIIASKMCYLDELKWLEIKGNETFDLCFGSNKSFDMIVRQKRLGRLFYLHTYIISISNINLDLENSSTQKIVV